MDGYKLHELICPIETVQATNSKNSCLLGFDFIFGQVIAEVWKVAKNLIEFVDHVDDGLVVVRFHCIVDVIIAVSAEGLGFVFCLEKYLLEGLDQQIFSLFLFLQQIYQHNVAIVKIHFSQVVQKRTLCELFVSG